MAYQNVGTPRFYINVLEWLASNMTLTGYSGGEESPAAFDNHFRTLPVNIEPTHIIFNSETNHRLSYDIPTGSFNDKSFFAVLGIVRENDDSSLIPYGIGNEWWSHSPNSFPIINCSHSGGEWSMDYDGFAIGSFPGTIIDNIGMRFENIIELGSVILGTYYDMPHSPDLKLTMSREMDGVKRIRTKGGADLVKHQYTKPPLWGTAAPWELYSGTPTNQSLSRSGRRTWDLSFSYLDNLNEAEKLIMERVGALYWAGFLAPSGVPLPTDEDYYDRTLLRHDNFYSQVIHKTNGGQLPFIFQPDSNDHNYAICKFDMKSFKFSQVANGVYSMKLKIREVW